MSQTPNQFCIQPMANQSIHVIRGSAIDGYKVINMFCLLKLTLVIFGIYMHL